MYQRSIFYYYKFQKTQAGKAKWFGQTRADLIWENGVFPAKPTPFSAPEERVAATVTGNCRNFKLNVFERGSKNPHQQGIVEIPACMKIKWKEVLGFVET